MRKAEVFIHGIKAGSLEELRPMGACRFIYDRQYKGPPISLTMPVERRQFDFEGFPPFFEGLLPEGYHLEALLRLHKRDARWATVF